MKVNDLFESQDAVAALIRKVCPKNFQLLISGRAVPMYRGTEQHAGYQTAETPMYHATVVPSRSKARRSASGSNIVLTYVDASPAWQQFPKRSQSILATTVARHADKFGPTHIILPADNVVNLAQVPRDFNFAETRHGDSLMSAMNRPSSFMDGVSWLLRRIEDQITDYPSEEFRHPDDARPPAILLQMQSMLRELGFASWTGGEIESIDTMAEVLTLSATIEKTISQVTALRSANPREKNGLFAELRAICESFRDGFAGLSLSVWLESHVQPKSFNARLLGSITEVTAAPSGGDEIWWVGDSLLIAPGYDGPDDVDLLLNLKTLKV